MTNDDRLPGTRRNRSRSTPGRSPVRQEVLAASAANRAPGARAEARGGRVELSPTAPAAKPATSFAATARSATIRLDRGIRRAGRTPASRTARPTCPSHEATWSDDERTGTERIRRAERTADAEPCGPTRHSPGGAGSSPDRGQARSTGSQTDDRWNSGPVVACRQPAVIKRMRT